MVEDKREVVAFKLVGYYKNINNATDVDDVSSLSIS